MSRSPCTTLGGDSPDLQVGVAATFVGGLLEPQLRREATTAAMTKATAAELRRRARAECRRQALISQPGLAKRSCQRVCKCGSGERTHSMFDRYNIIDEQDLARGVAK